MERTSDDIGKITLAALMHPLRDLAKRAWKDSIPDWVNEVCLRVETYCEMERWSFLVKRSVQLALGRKVSPLRISATDYHLPLVSIFSGLTLRHSESYSSPEQIAYFRPSIFAEKPVYPEHITINDITSKLLSSIDYEDICKGLFQDLKQLLENGLYLNNAMVLIQEYGVFYAI